MGTCFTGDRVAAVICVAVFFLASSRVVRGVAASQDGSVESAAPTCNKDKIVLEGTNKTLEFMCPAKAKLVPAEEAASVPEVIESEIELTKVYQFKPARNDTGSGPACNTGEASLGSLVPGSTLKKVVKKVSGKALNSESQQSLAVFRLTIGEGREEDKHLCYVCTPETLANGGVGGVGAHTSGSPCTVYVTVPRKEPSEPPPEGPSESGSSPPSVSGWLALSGTVCALGGLMFRL